jgi:glycosyltransferase involved in cell wall biosynthesis
MTGRIVYVLTGDAPADAVAAFDRWPTPSRTVAALREAGADVVGVARGATDQQVVHGGSRWTIVGDRSRAAWRVALQVRRLRPAAVHLNGTGFSLAAVALRLACPRATIVVQHHGEPPGSGGTVLLKRLVRRVVDGYLFTGGRAQAQPFVDAGVLTPTTPVHDVLESSADVAVLEQDEARRQTGMTGSPAVVSVGRLVPGKDPATVLRAFCTYAAGVPGAELWWLYHDDTLEPSLREELSARPDVAERVHLVGRVAPEDVGGWLSGADVFLSASRHEGSGYALIEAVRCGCTPVVSDIAPHRAIAGELGERFDVGDVASAAAALSRAVPDRAAASTRFDAALTWQSVAAQLLAAYDELCRADLVHRSDAF